MPVKMTHLKIMQRSELVAHGIGLDIMGRGREGGGGGGGGNKVQNLYMPGSMMVC